MDPPRRPSTVRPEPAALVPLLVLTVVWGWWAWKQGAYFGSIAFPVTGAVFPGTMVLCAATILLALVAPLRADLRASTPVRVALIALAALAGWTLLSALWSPAPDLAITDGQRVFAYVLAFGLGLGLCNLLGPRMVLSVVPVAVAGGIVAVATAITLAHGNDVGRYLAVDGTLQFPLGYRNANGAFFGIVFWALVGTAAFRAFSWWARGLAAGGATLCLSLVLLSQSRGSQLAAAISLVVFFVVFPRRANSLLWLGVAVLPCAVVVPHISDLFETTGVLPSTATVHSAGVACLLATVLATVLGAVVALTGRRIAVDAERERRADRAVGRGLIALGVVVAVAFVVAVGNPISWIDQKANQLNAGFGAFSSGQSTRFGLNFGTHRGGIWHVALGDGARHPLLGDGAGGFQYSFLEHRSDALETVHDAHGVEFETLAELGVPGLLMVVTFLGAAAVGIRRSRRLGPAAAALGAIALTAGVYWLAQTSVDWFWPYPGVTAPVVGLLGAACAPLLRTPRVRRTGRWRLAVCAGAAVLGISVAFPLFSERYVDSAFDEWRTSFPQAMADLDSAKSLMPMSSDPDLVRGAIARTAGRRNLAITALTKTADERPEAWLPHYYLALLYQRSDPGLARRELDDALAVNPLQPELKSLRRRLED
jgi:O-antigen ligase/polysaccharide polymerase Wzy-like membrane protein